jgi:hypothetical protein
MLTSSLTIPSFACPTARTAWLQWNRFLKRSSDLAFICSGLIMPPSSKKVKKPFYQRLTGFNSERRNTVEKQRLKKAIAVAPAFYAVYRITTNSR